MIKQKGNALISFGALLLGASLIWSGYNLWNSYHAGESARKTAVQLDAFIANADESFPEYVLYPNMDMPVQMIDGKEYVGVLSIPALDLYLPVLNEWSYENLKIAPSRYSGSAYLDNIVLCAHNYNTHFGRIRNLNIGDSIEFTDMDGHVFRYQVINIEILKSNDVELMKSGNWDMTLFTCTIGGETRITVRCERIKGFK